MYWNQASAWYGIQKNFTQLPVLTESKLFTKLKWFRYSIWPGTIEYIKLYPIKPQQNKSIAIVNEQAICV